MSNEIITFGNIEIRKCKFHHPKNLILIEDVGIVKIQVSSMVSSSRKNAIILLVTKMMIIKLNHYA